MFKIDPAHAKIDPFKVQMIYDVWNDKYRWKSESLDDMYMRIANAIYAKDSDLGPDNDQARQAYVAMRKLLWVPGGRIMAGAGTEKRVTMMNCYVNEKVEDSMEGIMHALRNTALTLQQGGGIGTDFSTLRPEGALLTRTHTKASGPLPFMHMWDRASATIRSAGDRRGAMMGTMCDTHPDLPKFIVAKREQGALTQFNVSVLISDAFMEAVKDDAEWTLHFPVEPMDRDPALAEYDFYHPETKDMQYVYSVWQARDLWKLITENTYEYSEPGVIFIDRVNELNNLYYCEDIRCTNPCGEQPLPPHGTCNLGHVNLARIVLNPFTPRADIDYTLLRETVTMGVRFLDNVIDVTQYPLEEQAKEEQSKRRLGLGYTGLADMLAQLGIRYGSPEAVRITEDVTREICWAAYNASADLAKEKGPFPLYDAKKYLGGSNFASLYLPTEIKKKIREHGIRNSLLLTIAPTGTGSIVVGNVSSGCEPVFLHEVERKVLKSTSSAFSDEHEKYIVRGYGAELYHSLFPDAEEYPDYMVTAEDLTVEEHIVMQAASQRWVDSSISKTVNIPKDTPYEQFIKVYDLAYTLGCKGCTTYRPSDIRGSVLSKPGEGLAKETVQEKTLAVRPQRLGGATYKLKWPSLSSAIYLTVNEMNDEAFEVFLSSKDAKYHDWTTALTVMITAIYRKGGDTSFIARELQQIQSLNDSAFINGRNHPSLPAYIGYMLEEHIAQKQYDNLSKITIQEDLISDSLITAKRLNVPSVSTVHEAWNIPQLKIVGERCPNCNQLTYFREEGCKRCKTCDFTTCG